MSKVALSGNASGTGTFTIASPNSNTDQTLTLPDNTGTILTTATAGVPVNGPAFSAYQSAGQAISTLTSTVVSFQVEAFDTASAFNNTGSTVGGIPAYAFKPTVAGYYQINGVVGFGGTSTGGASVSIVKNGINHRTGQFVNTSTTLGTAASVASVVYLDGSTDYVQLSVFVVTGSTTAGSESIVYFNGALVRSAT
jgi:hypothetical protein